MVINSENIIKLLENNKHFFEIRHVSTCLTQLKNRITKEMPSQSHEIENHINPISSNADISSLPRDVLVYLLSLIPKNEMLNYYAATLKTSKFRAPKHCGLRKFNRIKRRKSQHFCRKSVKIVTPEFVIFRILCKRTRFSL